MIRDMSTCCAGIDVHESMVVVCLLKGDFDKTPTSIVKEFDTNFDSLCELANWLDSEHCDRVAMESTGIYWKCVWVALENHSFKLTLGNARDIKNKPGRKTDTLDAEWIASLHRCGLIPDSFVPDKSIRELRNSTRLLRKYKQDVTKCKNRIHKILEESGIKLNGKISDLFGVTGTKILEKILKNDEIDLPYLYSITSGPGSYKLKSKVNDIFRALQCKVSTDNLRLLNILYSSYQSLLNSIDEISELINEQMLKFSHQKDLLKTIPGISDDSANSIIAEIGVDMSVFENYSHLSSWAGISPGNNESAGKKKRGKITKRGSRTLRGTLSECAWASIKRKDIIFSKLYGSYVKRMGKQKAIFAVANKILQTAYILMKNDTTYIEVETKEIQAKQKRKINKMISLLEKEGYQITAPASIEILNSTA